MLDGGEGWYIRSPQISPIRLLIQSDNKVGVIPLTLGRQMGKLEHSQASWNPSWVPPPPTAQICEGAGI